MNSFTYDSLPGRVIFGVGCRSRLAEEVHALGVSRVLLICDAHDPDLIDEFSTYLGNLCVATFAEIVQHVPRDMAEKVIALAVEHDVDALVSVGGGSSTGLAKAVNLTLNLPHVAVATTYAGSELTPIWGMTANGHKQTGRDLRVLPKVVLYDPELTLALPVAIAGPSAMNAFAHAAEGLYAKGRNPVISLVALEAIRVLARHLPRMCAHPDDIDERSQVLYGAYLAGATLAVSGTDLHHKTNHVLGGLFNLDHGQMNAVILPYALAYNAPAIEDEYNQISAILGGSAAGRVYDLARSIGAPKSLKEIGMDVGGIDEAAAIISAGSSNSVRPLDIESARTFLEAAYVGERPE